MSALGLLAFILIGLLGTEFSARSDELRLELDPARTGITFELGAALHTVHGSAQLTEGLVIFDTEGGAASGRIVAAADSLDTANQRRDKQMHAKVLESERYPEIAFHPDFLHGKVALDGRSRVTIDGRFSIHGGEHPLSVEALVDIVGNALEAILELEVPYVAWGMEDPSKLLLRVSKVVRVRIHCFGRLAPVSHPRGADLRPLAFSHDGQWTAVGTRSSLRLLSVEEGSAHRTPCGPHGDRWAKSTRGVGDSDSDSMNLLALCEHSLDGLGNQASTTTKMYEDPIDTKSLARADFGLALPSHFDGGET